MADLEKQLDKALGTLTLSEEEDVLGTGKTQRIISQTLAAKDEPHFISNPRQPILHQGKGGRHPLTERDLPWRHKADRIIASLSRDAWQRAQRRPGGGTYRKHHPYSVPELARQLVECLNTNDEERAKALFLSYEGMKAIGGGKRRSAAPSISMASARAILSKAKRYIASHKGGKRRHSDPDMVDVLFRVVKAGEFKGTVEAWFPAHPGTNAYWKDMLTYAHMGQHGSGDIDYMQQKTRNATPSEYANLKRELESLGPEPYKLRVVKKMTRKHFEQRKAACH